MRSAASMCSLPRTASNVNRADGIACLSNWESLLRLPEGSAFVGLLWPGDSIWAHGLDYPRSRGWRISGRAYRRISRHGIRRRGQHLVRLAQPGRAGGALHHQQHEPAGAVPHADGRRGGRRLSEQRIPGRGGQGGQISLLVSAKDEVLSFAFPAGNFLSGILAAGHPWWHAALGHAGAATPWPSNLQAPFMIPEQLELSAQQLSADRSSAGAGVADPDRLPPNGSPCPANGAPGWSEAFSAAFVSTRFR